MGTMICRPFITLRNGRRLFAHEVGKEAFCFEVDEVRPSKPKKTLDPNQGELFNEDDPTPH